MVARGSVSLLFIDNMTGEGVRMNSKGYRAILFAHIEPNAVKLIITLNILKNKRIIKQDILTVKQWDIFQWPNQLYDLLIRQPFS